MNQADPLAGLRDIHLPEPVSWWPPAPGWWLVTGLAVVLLALLLRFAWRRLARNRYRRIALAALNGPVREIISDREFLEEVAAVLRRAALAAYGRERVAPLVGEAWLAFLDETGRTGDFRSGAGRVLGPDLYRPDVEVNRQELLQVASNWIRRHRSC